MPIRQRRFTGPFISCIAGLLALGGCSTAERDSDAPVVPAVRTQTSPIFYSPTLIWSQRIIPVCWEEAGADMRKDWVRSAVEAQFESHSEFIVDFTGWGLCAPSSNGIRIRIADEHPHVVNLGNGLDGVENGMVLNFTFQSEATDDLKEFKAYCENKTGNERVHRECIQFIAVHEFGHALGLAHEQLRDDTPQLPDCEMQGNGGTVTLGEWDNTSVMNYCGLTWSNAGLLSDLDTHGLGQIYHAGTDQVLHYKAPSAASWEAHNITLLTQSGNLASNRAVLAMGSTIQLFASSFSGQLIQHHKEPGQQWADFNLTVGASGPRVRGEPVALLDGSAVQVFVRGEDGHLVTYYKAPNPAQWAAYDITTLSSGPNITGAPTAILTGSNVSVFARSVSGRLIQFFKAPSQQWVAFDISAAFPAVPLISGRPQVVTNSTGTFVFARGHDSRLVVFHAPWGGSWTLQSPTSFFTSAPLGGDPAVVYNGAFNVFVRYFDGTLRNYWSADGLSWSAYDVAPGVRITGRPSPVAVGNNVHVYVRGQDGQLLEFYKAPNPATWQVFDLTSSTNTGISGDPTAYFDGNAMQVFHGGPAKRLCATLSCGSP